MILTPSEMKLLMDIYNRMKTTRDLVAELNHKVARRKDQALRFAKLQQEIHYPVNDKLVK
jgi:hypothetical protein